MIAPTKQEVAAGVSIVFAVAEAIRELGSAPAGPIYAALMHKAGITMQDFEKIVGIITGAGLVAKRGDLLVWIGPMIAERESIMDEQRRAEKEGRP